MIKKLTVASLLLAAFFIFAGCSTTANSNDTDTGNKTDVVTEGKTSVMNDGMLKYTLIYPDSKDYLTSISVNILTGKMDNIGVKMLKTTDYHVLFADLEDERYEYEILLGPTNRPETAYYSAMLGEGQYLYAMAENGHIAVLGSSLYGTYKAAQAFSDNVLSKFDGECIPLYPGQTVIFNSDGTIADKPTEDDVMLAPDEDEMLLGWFDYGGALYKKDDVTPSGMNSIHIYMARNEKEGFQYILTSENNYDGLVCEVTDLADGQGNTLKADIYYAHYTNVTNTGGSRSTGGWCPDALVKQKKLGFTLNRNCSQTLYIQYETDIDTVPGVYTGVLTIKNGDKTVKAGKVTVTVWNIYYDEKTACQTAIGNDSWLSYKEYVGSGYSSKKFYDYMLDNRLCMYTLPYAELDDRVDEYLNNPRVTTFKVMNWSEKVYEKLSSNQEWLDKAYFYSVDEPKNAKNLQKVINDYKTIQSFFPGGRMVTPFYTIAYTDYGENTLSVFARTTTLWCPNTYLFSGSFRERMIKQQGEGDTVWWYVCGGQTGRTIDALANTDGGAKRLLFWQQYQYGVDGFLYWCFSNWSTTGNIWSSNPQPTDTGLPTTDGVLLYWDPYTGDPVGTLGVEALRDGVEDFQLLTMAEDVFDREELMEYIEFLSADVFTYTGDMRSLIEIRTEIGNRLEDVLSDR